MADLLVHCRLLNGLMIPPSLLPCASGGTHVAEVRRGHLGGVGKAVPGHRHELRTHLCRAALSWLCASHYHDVMLVHFCVVTCCSISMFLSAHVCSTHPSVASPPPSARSPRLHLLSCTAVAIPLPQPPLPPRLHPPLRLLHPLPWPLLLTSAPGRSPLCQSPRRSRPFAGCTPL